MEIAAVAESKRAGRYIVVRGISKVADYSVVAIFVYILGFEWIAGAYLCGKVLDLMVDFAGQKLWAFTNPDMRMLELLRELVGYLAVRCGNFAASTGTIYILYNELGFPLWATGAVIIAVFVPISFGLYRLLFVGSLNDLFMLLRLRKALST
ncbi:MAG: hypothetical protein JWO43_574 [Candidatus Adlerbacteria bacterium]|nr:hypothetical protein [Candidatus Adlerbacteria bacterium]